MNPSIRPKENNTEEGTFRTFQKIHKENKK